MTCSALNSRNDWWVLIHYSAKEVILITRSGINHQFAVRTDTSDLNIWIHSDQYDRSSKFVSKHHKNTRFSLECLFIRNLQTLCKQWLICNKLNNVTRKAYCFCWFSSLLGRTWVMFPVSKEKSTWVWNLQLILHKKWHNDPLARKSSL